MSIHVRIDRDTRVVEVAPQPPVSRGAAHEVLHQVVVASRAVRHCRVLIDGRATHGSLEVGSLWHLAAGLATDPPQRIERVAILARADDMSNARFFELAAQNRSLDARAFDD